MGFFMRSYNDLDAEEKRLKKKKYAKAKQSFKKAKYDRKKANIKKLREENTPEWKKKGKTYAKKGVKLLGQEVRNYRSKKRRSPQEKVFGISSNNYQKPSTTKRVKKSSSLKEKYKNNLLDEVRNPEGDKKSVYIVQGQEDAFSARYVGSGRKLKGSSRNAEAYARRLARKGHKSVIFRT